MGPYCLLDKVQTGMHASQFCASLSICSYLQEELISHSIITVCSFLSASLQTEVQELSLV